MVGLTGFEPVTLRLSSACSNQLSYRPFGGLQPAFESGEFKAQIARLRAFYGGMGIRTPDL
jgi:hypothetical protein